MTGKSLTKSKLLSKADKATVAATRGAGEPILKKSSQARWNEANRAARRAHHIVETALRKGTLKRGKCAVCGSFRVDAHHEDYSKPLDVVWLCRRHHRQLHAEQRRAAA